MQGNDEQLHCGIHVFINDMFCACVKHDLRTKLLLGAKLHD